MPSIYHINTEFVLCEFRTNEFREKIESVQEEIHQLDMDIEENQGLFWPQLITLQSPDQVKNVFFRYILCECIKVS